MGWRYRKSVKAGPFRLNFSKSGIGYSVGSKRYRVTKTAKGTVRETVTLPGGLSHVTEHKIGSGAKNSAPQRRPRFRAKIVWGVLFLISGAAYGTKDPATALTTCLVGAALVGWGLSIRRKLKNPERPVAETSNEDE